MALSPGSSSPNMIYSVGLNLKDLFGPRISTLYLFLTIASGAVTVTFQNTILMNKISCSVPTNLEFGKIELLQKIT